MVPLIGSEMVQIDNFSIEVPSDCGTAKSDKHTKLMFYWPNGKSDDPDTMLCFDIGKPVDRDAKETAEKFSKNWNGKITEEINLDGITGYHVVIKSEVRDMSPREAVILFNSNKAYLAILGSKAGAVNVDLLKVLSSWKWDVALP